MNFLMVVCSNNTNKLSPQELIGRNHFKHQSSNNTNKLSPQERRSTRQTETQCSNNTNKLSPQERSSRKVLLAFVQIIQINLVLKNLLSQK